MSLCITIDITDYQKLINLRNFLDTLIKEQTPDEQEKEIELVPLTVDEHIVCECGSTYKPIYQRKHIKSKKHIEFFTTKEKTE